MSHCAKKVLVVLDNADQKPTDFQVAVYDTAQQLATALPATILISLRESTYYRLCRLPQADAFSQQDVFHIRAPNIQSVVDSRFDFLAKELAHTKQTITSAHGIDLTITDIERFTRLLKRSLLEGKDAARIAELLASVSNGSVRESLNLIYDFLTSGHTKMEEYIRDYAVSETSRIPFHEFLSSIMLGDMAYFREDQSRAFVDLFARSAVPGDSHFTRLRLLYLVRAVSPSNELRPDDYVRLDRVRDEMLMVGVPDTVLAAHLQTLIRYGLLHTDTQTLLDEPASLGIEYEGVNSVHISASGQYYLDVLAGRFEYLQRVIPDVPIRDSDALAALESIFGRYRSNPASMPIDQAAICVRALLQYFEAEEEREHGEGILARNPLLSNVRFVDSIRLKVAPQITVIESLTTKRRA